MIASENKDLIAMSNDLARASYRLTTNEIRLILVAISQMPKSVKNKDGTYDDVKIDPNQPYYITKEDFIRLGVAPNNVAHEIRSACSELMNRKVTIDTPLGDLEFHWVNNVLHFKTEKFEELKRRYPNSKYDEDFIQSLKFHNLVDSLKFITNSDDNIVARVVFSADIIKYISQLKNQFTRLNLEDFKGFGSFYSFRVYMLMMSWQSTRFVRIKLDDFRKMLDLVDKYGAVADLKKRVLDVAIEDINKNSPYNAEYNLIDKNGKAGRGIKLTHLEIKFKAKSKAVDGKFKEIKFVPHDDNTKLNNDERLTIKASADKHIAEKRITDENHKANIYAKAERERWGLGEYDKQVDDMNAQNARVLAKIETDNLARNENEKKVKQKEKENNEFISYFESLPQSEQNKINEQVKEEVSKLPIIGNKFKADSYKDIMYRVYFKKVMNFKN